MAPTPPLYSVSKRTNLSPPDTILTRNHCLQRTSPHNELMSCSRWSTVQTNDLHSFSLSESSPPNQSWLHFLPLSGPPRLHVLVMYTFRQGRPCATHQCKQVASCTRRDIATLARWMKFLIMSGTEYLTGFLPLILLLT